MATDAHGAKKFRDPRWAELLTKLDFLRCTAGCHNYHDHRSISTGFLLDNIKLPSMLPQPTLPDTEGAAFGVPIVKVKLDEPPPPDLSKEFLGG